MKSSNREKGDINPKRKKTLQREGKKRMTNQEKGHDGQRTRDNVADMV